MRSSRRTAIAAAVAAAAVCSSADIPRPFGAAQLHEDTTVASVSTMCADSTRRAGWPLSTGVRVLALRLPGCTVSLRSGAGGGRPGGVVPLYMQEAAMTVPLGRSELQAVFGYQPVRVRSAVHTASEITGEYIFPETYRLDIYNSDRFYASVNGMTALSEGRNFLYGIEAVGERLSGAKYYQLSDYELSYDYLEYQRYGDGDGSFTLHVAAGYWRDLDRGNRRYRVLLFAEGSVNAQREAVRFDGNSIPALQAFTPGDDRYQHTVRATGGTGRGCSTRLGVQLSPQYIPVMPRFADNSASLLLTTGDVELVSFGIGVNASENYTVTIDRSEVFPGGVGYGDIFIRRWGPDFNALHRFRLYATHETVARWIACFGTVVYRSTGEGIKQGGKKAGAWENGTDWWLGMVVTGGKRFAVEAAWKGLSTWANVHYVNGDGIRSFEPRAGYSVAAENAFSLKAWMLW